MSGSTASRQGSLLRSGHQTVSAHDANVITFAPLDGSRRGSGSSIASSLVEDGSIGRRGSLSKRQRAKAFGHNLKLQAKRALGRSTDDVGAAEHETEFDSTLDEGSTNGTVFAYTKDFQRGHKTIGDVVQDGLGLAKNAAKVVIHPMHHPKSKAAGALTAATEHPFLSEEADHELLQAHDEMKKATPAPFSDNQQAWDELGEKREKFDKLQNDRQARQDAWVLGKHVDRVRVVPLRLIDYPKGSDFHEYDSDGEHVRWQWERYVGHLLLYSSQGFTAQYVDETGDQTFRRDSLLRILERLLIASNYWQNWLMHVRKVYRWEDKINSSKWLVCYFVLLITGYIVTPAFLWIIYITVKNKLAMDDVRFLRESHERAETGKTPQKLSELVSRHGGEGWVDPLLDEIGPTLQQQLGDVADFLEIIYNFYTWQKPRLTIYTLLFFLTCFIVGALTPTEFGMKVAWWVFGIYFFFSRPIASHYAKYRKVVSLPRWIFWNIPTNAELAMDHLRTQAQIAREEMILKRVEKEIAKESVMTPEHAALATGNSHANGEIVESHPRRSSISSASTVDSEDDGTYGLLGNTDIMSFRSKCDSQRGRLIVSTTGLRFIKDNTSSSSPSGDILWSHNYTTLFEMRKTLMTRRANPLSKRSTALKSNALMLEFADNITYTLGSMPRRDEAFNTIIGISALKFQKLQPLAGEVDGDEGGGFKKGSKGAGGSSKGGVFAELGKLW